MSVFTSKMMAAFTPTDVFINLYDLIMKEYEREAHPLGAYDELAKTTILQYSYPKITFLF
ncbi:hypothetical protein [Legionella longbeachae]|uniref:Uncharacterized protein n=1 Tax=Legionella longbeachae serogroup 1 (strain NSW150) TaxID=661367 RepID=D3HK36_LEGLN|nr:hypothetical protein [Legionella longbeachae]VEE03319.1 Uncharacterised protein [Legionella oakridgensis]HBD7399169.1 hypothetical protein [Legionella pneumophila]ARB93785.1 hypothetical protein A6J40_17090 [Legionella longbeachae]ARM33075.1 hypothetical protein B0B39_05865 [Legionella longbeachae]EEZ94090.1 hypothetical protein LLB_2989 [Legionella longbeachae D-4968]